MHVLCQERADGLGDRKGSSESLLVISNLLIFGLLSSYVCNCDCCFQPVLFWFLFV